MSIQPLLLEVEQPNYKTDEEDTNFEIGDTVDVHYKILEGDKERIQIFTGIVIARRGGGTRETFTVRRIVDGQGVERIFPVHSPKIAKIEIKRRAVVRRAKLYYLRDRIGKKAFTLKERPIISETSGRKRARITARKAKKAQKAQETVVAVDKKKERAEKRKKAREKKKDKNES